MSEHEMRERMVGAFNDACRRVEQEAVSVIHDFYAPSVRFRPTLSLDGTLWCALYGDNLQDGVAGWGPSPDLAMRSFDVAWTARLPATPGATP